MRCGCGVGEKFGRVLRFGKTGAVPAMEQMFRGTMKFSEHLENNLRHVSVCFEMLD